MTRYRMFDRSQVYLRDVADRGHLLTWSACLPLEAAAEPFACPELAELVCRLAAARRAGRAVILFIGGHPIKLGLSRFLIDLLDRRLVTHLATNGAGLIHDFELALVGGTSEDVARWIRAGQFGLWRETGRLNDVIREAAANGEGLGEAVGRVIEEERFPHRDLSIAAAGWRNGVPVTCHVTIGADIIHALPSCDGAAIGQTSYTDFLILARSVQDLEGGAFLNAGSAVTGPEVYLKALSLARNVARQEGREVQRFYHGGVRPDAAARGLARPDAQPGGAALLPPALENHPGPHRRRRRSRLLHPRRHAPDAAGFLAAIRRRRHGCALTAAG
jgi:hypothetical protein